MADAIILGCASTKHPGPAKAKASIARSGLGLDVAQGRVPVAS